MRYKKLLVVVLSIAMVFAFAACGSNDKGSADNGDKKNVSDKLEFKGKWVKAGPLKMGFPKGWYMGKNDIFSSKDRSSIDMRDTPPPFTTPQPWPPSCPSWPTPPAWRSCPTCAAASTASASSPSTSSWHSRPSPNYINLNA